MLLEFDGIVEVGMLNTGVLVGSLLALFFIHPLHVYIRMLKLQRKMQR